MELKIKQFLRILRRATRCGFPSVIVNNHMLMQCYNLDIDSEVGLQYALHIPDSMDEEFYETPMVLRPREILKVYSEGHKDMELDRKEQGLKPSASSESLEYIVHKHHIELIFHFILAGEEHSTRTYKIDTRAEASAIDIENCARSYNTLVDRIKPGGTCLLFDGGYMGLQQRIADSPEIYHYRVKIHGQRVDVPFTKSMFLGIKTVDKFYFSLQESNMDGIYIFSISLEKQDIVEQFWGYVLQYR